MLPIPIIRAEEYVPRPTTSTSGSSTPRIHADHTPERNPVRANLRPVFAPRHVDRYFDALEHFGKFCGHTGTEAPRSDAERNRWQKLIDAMIDGIRRNCHPRMATMFCVYMHYFDWRKMPALSDSRYDLSALPPR